METEMEEGEEDDCDCQQDACIFSSCDLVVIFVSRRHVVTLDASYYGIFESPLGNCSSLS